MIKVNRTMKVFPAFLESIVVDYYQALEFYKEGGLKGILRPRFFWKRKATPVALDLATVTSPVTILKDAGYQFVELTMESLVEGKLFFAVPSRGVKASRNLKKGWRGFALIQDSRVVGDIWCVTPAKDGTPAIHSDLRMLGLTCGYLDAYAFDMYIAAAHRGENLAAPFQRSLQATLRAEGCRNVYGYYWDDNLPALWMHRVLKFKELPKRQVSRFLVFQKAETITGTSHITKKPAQNPIRENQVKDSSCQPPWSEG